MSYLVGDHVGSTCHISLGMVTHGVVHVVSRWGWLHMETYMLCLVGYGYTWSSTCISLGRVTHGVVHVSRWGGLHMK